MPDGLMDPAPLRRSANVPGPRFVTQTRREWLIALKAEKHKNMNSV